MPYFIFTKFLQEKDLFSSVFLLNSSQRLFFASKNSFCERWQLIISNQFIEETNYLGIWSCKNEMTIEDKSITWMKKWIDWRTFFLSIVWGNTFVCSCAIKCFCVCNPQVCMSSTQSMNFLTLVRPFACEIHCHFLRGFISNCMAQISGFKAANF